MSFKTTKYGIGLDFSFLPLHQKTVVKILNVQQKQEGLFTQVILFAYYFQDVLNIVVGWKVSFKCELGVEV